MSEWWVQFWAGFIIAATPGVIYAAIVLPYEWCLHRKELKRRRLSYG